MIDEKRIYNYIRALINPYGKPFEGTTYELGLKIMKYIEEMEKVKYPLNDCVGDCKNCWKTKLVNDTKVGEWISCSERLPSTEKPYKSVLLQLKKSMVVGCINKAGQWFVDTGDGWCADLDEKPIAWMPLPEPYKEDMRGGKNGRNDK